MAKRVDKEDTGLTGRSGLVVVAAILMYVFKYQNLFYFFVYDESIFCLFFIRNGIIFILKVVVWRITNSHSMFAEAIHSVADTANQIILAFGIHKSVKVRIIYI